MNKLSEFEKWAITHPYDYWAMQDEHINKQDIKLYEGIYKNKTTKGLAKEGLELLYVERKQIAVRKTDIGSQAGSRVLRWRGEGITQPVRGTDIITQESTDIQPKDVGIENGFDDSGSEDIYGEVGFGLTDGD